MISFNQHPLIKPFLNQIDNGFPKKELELIFEAKEEITPVLIQILEDFIAEPDKYDGFGNNPLHVISLTFLAQFDVHAAWPLLYHILRTYHVGEECRYSDLINTIDEDDVYKIYARIGASNTADLMTIVFDETLDYILRTDCLLALQACYFEGDLSRLTFIDFLSQLLKLFQNYDEYETGIIYWFDLLCTLKNIYAYEIEETIKSFIPEDILEDEMVQFKLEEMQSFNEVDYLHWLQDGSIEDERVVHGYIHNSLPYLEKWFDDNLEFVNAMADHHAEQYLGCEPKTDNREIGYFDSQPFIRELPKIGRNDLCPCESGKKFKKCCGK